MNAPCHPTRRLARSLFCLPPTTPFVIRLQAEAGEEHRGKKRAAAEEGKTGVERKRWKEGDGGVRTRGVRGRLQPDAGQ